MGDVIGFSAGFVDIETGLSAEIPVEVIRILGWELSSWKELWERLARIQKNVPR